MKSPQVVHFRCLDTFGLRGVAQSHGGGGAGMRLTRQGLTEYVRQSRRALEKAPPPVVSDEEPVETFVRSSLPPSMPARASMPSLVTIEMGLRKPTTWAVLLLTLGVSFGVVLARVASRSRATPPTATAAAPREPRPAPPRVASDTAPTETPTLATTIISADPATAPAAHASSAQAHAPRSSHAHRAAPGAAPSTEPDDKSATAEPGAEPEVPPVSTERVQQELSDSL